MEEKLFSKKLSELIKTKGITQKELAGYLKFSPETISKYCRGDAEPCIEILVKISNYFHVTLDELIINKEKEEYFSPLALSVKGGIASFYEFIKQDLNNILKKDDVNKDFIDYLIKFNKKDELLNLIECCFSTSKIKVIEEKKNKYLGIIEDLEYYTDENYLTQDFSSVIYNIFNHYPIITDRINIIKTDLQKKVVDLESFNQYVKPAIDEVLKEVKNDLLKDFYFAEVQQVRTKLQNIKHDVLRFFIRNKSYDYAMRSDVLIVNKLFQSDIKVNYDELQTLLIKNKAPIDVLRYFVKNTRISEEFRKYIIECLNSDPNLVEDYKKTVFENYRSLVKDSNANFKISYYSEYLMTYKIKDELVELYNLLSNYYYGILVKHSSPIDFEQFPSIMSSYFSDIKKLKKYCQENNDINTWNEVLNKESSQKLLNIKTYGINMYQETDYNKVILLKEKYLNYFNIYQVD